MDANVVVEVVGVTGSVEPAMRLLERVPEWAAPPLWRSEVRSVLMKYHRAGRLALPLVQRMMRDAELLVSDADVPLGSPEILETSAISGCTPYDCEYVLAAARLQVPLVTRDRAVLRAFPSLALTPEAAVAWFE